MTDENTDDDPEIPNPNRDEENGRFTEGYTDGDVLDAIRALGGSGATREIANEVGCARNTAYLKLQSLHEEGRIQSRTVGASKLWEVQDQ